MILGYVTLSILSMSRSYFVLICKREEYSHALEEFCVVKDKEVKCFICHQSQEEADALLKISNGKHQRECIFG